MTIYDEKSCCHGCSVIDYSVMDCYCHGFFVFLLFLGEQENEISPNEEFALTIISCPKSIKCAFMVFSSFDRKIFEAQNLKIPINIPQNSAVVSTKPSEVSHYPLFLNP